MKRVKAKGVPVVVYEPTLDAQEFFGSEVTHDLEAFKAGCDVIVANRWSDELADVATRRTRGICLRGSRGERLTQVFRNLNTGIKLSTGCNGWRRYTPCFVILAKYIYCHCDPKPSVICSTACPRRSSARAAERCCFAIGNRIFANAAYAILSILLWRSKTAISRGPFYCQRKRRSVQL